MTQPLTRRSALQGVAISAAAAVVGFVTARARRSAGGAGASTAANAYGPVSTKGRLLTALDKVPADGGVVVAKAKVVVTRSGETVHGFSAVCTHEGCTVGSVERGVILCPCHGSQFDAQTGAVVTGPATRPLAPVAVVLRNGNVFTT
jgi:Rieske Fe-S protein